MARRDTARLAAMSDPDRNRWFRCAWVLPPPLQRKSPGAPTPGRIFESTISNTINTAGAAKEQARALAERLFSGRSAR
jgi:hypothetical protein